MRPVAVLGAGAFGTALACAEAAEGLPVVLWGRDAGAMAEIATRRENARRLPGVTLPEAVVPVADLATVAEAQALLLALPAQQTEGFLRDHGRDLPPVPLVLCAKGISGTDFRLQSEIAAEFCPDAPCAVLTGPGFAAEIARGPAHRADARLCGPGGRAAVAEPAVDAAAAALPDRGRGGGAARRGSEERDRHRLRHGRGREAGRERAGGADDPRLRRDGAAGGGAGGAARDAGPGCRGSATCR
jgi:hypothetical protein